MVQAANLSPWRMGFDPKSVHVEFVVEKVALGKRILQVPRVVLLLSFYQCSMFIHLSSTLILATDSVINTHTKKKNFNGDYAMVCCNNTEDKL